MLGVTPLGFRLVLERSPQWESAVVVMDDKTRKLKHEAPSGRRIAARVARCLRRLVEVLPWPFILCG